MDEETTPDSEACPHGPEPCRRTKRRRFSLRRWLFWLAVIGFIWFLASRLGDLKQLAGVLAAGHWLWILAAAASQIGYFVLFAWMFQAAFSAVGVQTRVHELVPVVLGAVFVNTLAPSGGTAGMALYADNAVRRGQSGTRATAGALLATVVDFFAFAAVLLAGMAHLFAHNQLNTAELAAAALLTLVSAVQVAVLILALGHPKSLLRALRWVQRAAERLFRAFHHVSPLHVDWAEATTDQLADAARIFRTHPLRIAKSFTIGIASNAISISTLYFLFLAFGQPPSMGVLVSGYAMAILFLNVSPVPQGIGVVEGFMTLVFTSLGVPAASALAVTLAFRGMSLWVPIVLGFLLLRSIPLFSSASPQAREMTSTSSACREGPSPEPAAPQGERPEPQRPQAPPSSPR
jgi:uncharacterized protein (TIRG00374 family)